MTFGSNVHPKRFGAAKRRLIAMWSCRCKPELVITTAGRTYKLNPGYLARCNDCGKERPSG